MPIPSNLTIEQSDAIEDGLEILFAAVQGAVYHLNRVGERKLAVGLQKANFNLDEAVRAIWRNSK